MTSNITHKHRNETTVSLTKVFMGRHPANCLQGNDSQQSRAYKGANPREEEEEPHDGTLHGLWGCRIGKLQTYNKNVKSIRNLV